MLFIIITEHNKCCLFEPFICLHLVVNYTHWVHPHYSELGWLWYFFSSVSFPSSEIRRRKYRCIQTFWRIGGNVLFPCFQSLMQLPTNMHICRSIWIAFRSWTLILGMQENEGAKGNSKFCTHWQWNEKRLRFAVFYNTTQNCFGRGENTNSKTLFYKDCSLSDN